MDSHLKAVHVRLSRFDWRLIEYHSLVECNCDQYGSLDVQCDILTGQCPCKENFMGQRCDLCEENKYRDGFECPSMIIE
jgi:Laminin EGF domain